MRHLFLSNKYVSLPSPEVDPCSMRVFPSLSTSASSLFRGALGSSASPAKGEAGSCLWPWLVGDTSQVRNHSSAMDFLGFRMFIWGFPLFSCFCEISWFSLLFESFIFFSFFGVWSHSEMLSYSFRWLLPCICPWLLFLFLKHGCFPRCRPLPGPLLWHFSRDLHCSHVNYYLLP